MSHDMDCSSISRFGGEGQYLEAEYRAVGRSIPVRSRLKILEAELIRRKRLEWEIVTRAVAAELKPTCHFAMAPMQASSSKIACDLLTQIVIAGLRNRFL